VTADFRQGFVSHTEDIERTSLPVTGDLPAWLEGTLIRNGPARFEAGPHSYRHWFDGLAMLHSFHLAAGQVHYTGRFIQSRQYARDTAAGSIHYSGFAIDPCRSLFSRVMSVFFPEETGNNTNVNVARLAGRYLALTETPLAMEFDPRTLATLGVVGYDDDLTGQVTTAHPHDDPDLHAGINLMTHFGPTTQYHLFRITATGRTRIAALPVQQPAYMHSFGLTQRYIVLCEFSFRLPHVLKLAFRTRPFIENFVFQPQQDTVFTVVDKVSGAVVARVPADPFFAFHHVNAYEDGDRLIVDICAYEDAALIGQLYLDALRGPGGAPQVGQLRRYSVPLAGGRATWELLSTDSLDLPRIHYRRCNGRDYQFAYGAGGRSGTQDFLNQLVKVDVKQRTSRTWYAPGCYPGEPVFVPAPDAAAEDDGVLLSVVLDAAAGTSFLLVLAAATMTEIARAQVPAPLPFGFHGQFFGGV
jgi:carotenoid cleavage dioxygenase-like enzyme